MDKRRKGVKRRAQMCSGIGDTKWTDMDALLLESLGRTGRTNRLMLRRNKERERRR